MIANQIIDIISNILIFIIIVDTILVYFLSPYHPLRATLDKIVQPMLSPLRRFIPLVANLDFSPLVLIIIIEILTFLLEFLIRSL